MHGFRYFVWAWISGLLVGWFYQPKGIGLIIMLLLLLAVLFILLLPSRYSLLRRQGLILSICAGLLSGWSMMLIRYPDPHIEEGVNYSSSGRVVMVKENRFQNQLIVSLLEIDPEVTHSIAGTRILVELPLPEEANVISVGDILQMNSNFKPFDFRSEVSAFGKKGYWAGFGIRYYTRMDYSEIRLAGRKSAGGMVKSLSKFIALIRLKLYSEIALFQVAESNKTVIKAMLLGDKRGMDRDIKKVFSTAGIMHLLAVSGLHVGLVFMVLMKLMTLIGFPQNHPLNRCVCILTVWLYVFVCGIPPSAGRAAGMISLFILSRWMGRQVTSIHLVYLVCFFHTIIEPAGIFSTGFLLSYLAILGILVYFPKFQKALPVRNIVLKRIRDLAGISLAAQTLTIPVVLFVFARFPVYFLLGNIILMPLGLFIFYLCLVILFVQSLGLQIPIVYNFINWLMDTWISLGSLLGKLPGSTLIVQEFPVVECLFYLGLLFVFRNGLKKSILQPYAVLWYLFIWGAVGFLYEICNKL
ncbi:MAG: ComEC/Rec2 family competence protein [Bacteroidetes bacterium]|jgi:competence protein ComEC|nr:ComEC/Rec2 family competence protein [Bacteroidota bacterium]MBT3751273.1 ComEC/Rec2 family competence protein [Bacteroidota bacterium]MBT4401209.1 ComEC/Rec2 family competence protein [Bacteroidota bacterium]MBT4409375.1 ComEC/Rec2 family competence protein [Bacteroidota bacterium]MBT7463633.1 ComEC/Rec2 family competence protein [Bacteroidota bacterium]